MYNINERNVCPSVLIGMGMALEVPLQEEVKVVQDQDLQRLNYVSIDFRLLLDSVRTLVLPAAAQPFEHLQDLVQDHCPRG